MPFGFKLVMQRFVISLQKNISLAYLFPISHSLQVFMTGFFLPSRLIGIDNPIQLCYNPVSDPLFGRHGLETI
jgi:hypothetical protein